MRKDACERVSDSLHRHVEGELRPLESTVVREHLERCARCRHDEAAVRAEQVWLLENLLDSPPLSTRLSGKIVRRIASSRKRTRRSRRTSASRAASVERRSDRPVRWEVVAAAAASIAVLVIARAVPTSTPGLSLSAPSPERSAREPSAPEPSRAAPTAVAERLAGTIDPAPRDHHRTGGGAAGLRPAAGEPGHDARDTVAASVLAAPAGRGVYRTGWTWRRSERLNLAHVVDMAHSFAQPERRTLPEKIPCEADPNDDGKTDLNDIAFSCQVLLGRQSLVDALSRAAADGESGTLNDLECEEDCLRV